jgi:polysaccharide deacetylase family protein (PEP-CTERM system associated)
MDCPYRIFTMTEERRRTPGIAMTIDVEDYYHVSAFEKNIPPADWQKWPSRVDRNTRYLLERFDAHGIKATFFVLGWVAERQRELIAEIGRRGHEIASHGYSHRLVYNQTPDMFREETARSKSLLEDIVQKPVLGYRAASYSITRKSLWALDILAELGFRWDSSIFPTRHDRYGIPDSPTAPYLLTTPNGAQLTEFPLTTATLGPMRLPAAGGGYFRLYPYWLSKTLLQRAERHNGSAIFYLHPWEIDPEQPRVAGASLLSRFRHYNNLARCPDRLERLMQALPFGTVTDVLAHCRPEHRPLPQFAFHAA